MTTDLSHVEPTMATAVRGALADLRANALSIPVELMQTALAEYAERRTAFRIWLKEQLVEGTHYGVPPGCEPKTETQANGEIWYGVWSKGAYRFYPPAQWTPKPSLYKAGADFIIDLMGARDEYESDLAGWEQLGKPAGVFVRKCKLYSKATGNFLGEGTGCRKVGQKGGDENNAVKMSDKAAKVAAVLNTWGLADLFTQDEPPEKPLHDNPAGDPTAPTAPARGDRVTVDNLRFLLGEFKSFHENKFGASPKMPEDWEAFVNNATGRVFPVRSPAEWRIADAKLCKIALGIGEPEDGP